MTTTSHPDILVQIRSNNVGDDVEISKFYSDNIDKNLNILVVYNAKNLKISNFICTSTNP